MKIMSKETKLFLIKLNKKRQELLNIKDKTPQVENEIKNLNYQINNIILTFKYGE